MKNLISNVDDFVKIRPFGGIVIFNSILCDGEDKHIDQSSIFCYTHIHTDHIIGFEDALSKPNTTVLTTEITKKLISTLKGKGFVALKNNFYGLDYNEIKKIDDFEISFRKANHILGSGELLVRGPIGSVLYSSDFMLKGTDTNIKDVDVLVLDANHGSEDIPQDFLEPSEARKKMNEILQREIGVRSRQVNIRAHVGTLQKIMAWCDSACQKHVPFFANAKDISISDVYREEMGDFREIKSDKSNEFYEISKFEHPYVHFLRLSAPLEPCETQDPMVTSIHFSDGRYNYDHTNDYARIAGINLKEHASLLEILEYVDTIKPKMVVVDNGPARLGNPKNAIDLSKTIQKKLGIKAIYSPEKRPSETIE